MGVLISALVFDGVDDAARVGVPVAGSGLLSGRCGGLRRSERVSGAEESQALKGLSSTAGMQKAGRSAGYEFGVRGGIAVISRIASRIGYARLQSASVEVVAFITASAVAAQTPRGVPRQVRSTPDPSAGHLGVIFTLQPENVQRFQRKEIL
ncbi:hypothetical protein [Cryobacterium gelidum]|uniref:hypothetical protein n=1 Tax=Cryobacterium gelidum TaxID=1259164 RepID=UPI0015821968|nr:hypothetical protein [Cryobacterium gelidum]